MSNTRKQQILEDVKNGKVYVEGDFSFLADQASDNVIYNHWRIAKAMHLEEYFKTASTPFMFNDDPILVEFGETASRYGAGHSIASFAIVCRHMQAIFRNWQSYVDTILATYK